MQRVPPYAQRFVLPGENLALFQVSVYEHGITRMEIHQELTNQVGLELVVQF